MSLDLAAKIARLQPQCNAPAAETVTETANAIRENAFATRVGSEKHATWLSLAPPAVRNTGHASTVVAFVTLGGPDLTARSRCCQRRSPPAMRPSRDIARTHVACTAFAFVASACARLVSKALTAVVRTNHGASLIVARMIAVGPTLRGPRGNTGCV